MAIRPYMPFYGLSKGRAAGETTPAAAADPGPAAGRVRRRVADVDVARKHGAGRDVVTLLKYAREKQADLIVMAHHTREVDIEAAELGSTVEQVVLRAACPVASVNHPDMVDRLLRLPLVARLLAIPFAKTLRGTYCSMAGDLPDETFAFTGETHHRGGQA